MNLRKPRRRGFFISVPSRLGAGAQFHFLDSEFQTFATNLGDTADSPRTEGRRDSLIRERYVIEGRPLETSPEKILRADEGGTSPRAGPVSAAAVILKPGTRITGIDESKKLDANSREALAIEIKEKAASWSVAFVEVEESDTINILGRHPRNAAGC
jgi:hypothetical protein